MFYRNLGGPENWGQQVKITSPQPTPQADFGYSVALSGDHALIGSPYLNTNQGASFHYIRNLGGQDQWGISSTLNDPNPQPQQWTGFSVAIFGEYAAFGEPGLAYFPGSTILLKLSGDGVQVVATLADPPPNTTNGDTFGWSLGLDSRFCIIGAAYRGAGNVGAAYSVALPPSPTTTKPTFPRWALILIITVGVALLAGSGVLGLFIYSRTRRNSSSASSKLKRTNTSDLLEFSPKSDMKFIDIHSASGRQQIHRSPTIFSGTSLSSGVSLNSGATNLNRFSSSSLQSDATVQSTATA